MLKILVLIVLFSSTSLLYSQAGDKTLIEEGVKLHEQGKYKEAIATYNKVLLSDHENMHALAEKAYSQMGLKEYKKAISTCKKALKIKTKDKEPLKLIYTTYGNALDLSGKPKDAIKIYDKGLQEHPGFYSLQYNKGVTMGGISDWDGAIEAFQQSVQARPNHSSSFLALGRMLAMKKQKIPALLSYLRFHAIEPDSRRAKENFDSVQELVFSNVENTGGYSISISLPSESLEELGSEGKSESDFRSIELMLSMQSALDLGENQKEIAVVEQFERKLNAMFTVLGESKKGNSGFYWEFLAPYFIALTNKKFDKVLAYLVFSNQNDEQVEFWIKENKNKIRSFYEWSAGYNW